MRPLTVQKPEYPPIEPGASLLLAWQLGGKKVLLVGGGEIASQRLGFLLEAGAHVTIVSPAPLHPLIQYRLEENPDQVTWQERHFNQNPDKDPCKLASFDMVFTAIDDAALSRLICEKSRKVRTPVNVADVPPECDFYFGAQVRRGPLQVMISTSGAGPKVSVIVRDLIRGVIPPNIEGVIAGVGALRKELRERAPGVGGELSKKRMRWMINTCNAWDISVMDKLEDDRIRAKLLDDGWEKGVTLGPADVGVKQASKSGSTLSPTVAASAGGVLLGAAIGVLATLAIVRRN